MSIGLSTGSVRHTSQTALWGLPFTGWSWAIRSKALLLIVK